MWKRNKIHGRGNLPLGTVFQSWLSQSSGRQMLKLLQSAYVLSWKHKSETNVFPYSSNDDREKERGFMRLFLPEASTWHGPGLSEQQHSDSSLGLSFVLGKDNEVPVTQGHWKETKVELAIPSFLDSRGLCQWGNFLYLPSVLNYSIQCRISASSSMDEWKPVLTVPWLASYVDLLLAAYNFPVAHQILCLLLFSLTQKSVAEWERRIRVVWGQPNLAHLTAQTFKWTASVMFTFSEVLRIKCFT